MQVIVYEIMALRPCAKYTENSVKKLWNGRKSLTLLEISELDIPFNDRLWAITKLLKDSHARELRLFACDCAERVLPLFEERYPDDNRPRKAIETARRYANGDATKNELWAVYYSARAAADAARAADAAWAAAGCDAGDTKSEEQEWQIKRLQQMIKEIEKCR